MLLDATLLLGDTMVTTTAGASTSSVDCQAASNDYKGALFVAQTETTAATYDTGQSGPWAYFELQSSSSATFADSVITLVSSATINPASMGASKILCAIPIPSGAKRYIRGYFQVRDYSAGSPNRFFTAVSYSMYITYDADLLISGAQ